MIYRFNILFFLIFIWVLSLPSAPGYTVNILESSDDHILFRVYVDSVSVVHAEENGKWVAEVNIPGCEMIEKPGSPHTPRIGVMLGIPPSGDPRVSIVQKQSSTRDVGMLTGTDNSHHSLPEWFPGKIVSHSEPGFIRNQRVLPVHINPVRYSASSQLTQIVRTVIVRIDFDQSHSSNSGIPNSRLDPEFEDIYRQFLNNYETSRSWRVSNNTSFLAKSTKESKPRYNIKVHKDGVYAVSGEELAQAGADLSAIDPKSLALSNRGQPVPIIVEGQGDGVLDKNDRIIFVGEHNWGEHSYYSYYSDTNVYVLTWGGKTGLRYVQVPAIPGDQNSKTITTTPATVHIERDVTYRRLVGYEDTTQDHWYWMQLVDGEKYDIPVHLPHPVVDQPVQIQADFYGFTDSREAEIDHHVVVSWNGKKIGDAYGRYKSPFSFSKTGVIPNMVENNTVRFELPLDLPEVSVDHVFFNWLDIQYHRHSIAENGVLKMELPAKQANAKVTGFETGDILLLSEDGRRLTHADVSQDEKTFSVRFSLPGGIPLSLYAVERSSLLSVDGIEKCSPENLRSHQRGADYIIITHPDFADQANRLADHRATQSMRTAIVSIKDIYDEFSYGLYDPRAIKRFLKHAFENWPKPEPLYVLLMGDTSYEMNKWLYNDDLKKSFVPSMMQFTATWGMTSSDNYFVAVSGDDILPDMFVGRLPVNTPEQAGNMVSKIIAHETQSPVDEWRRQICLATGDEPFFELCAQHAVDNVIPDRYKTNWVSTQTQSPHYHTTSDLIDWINSGQSVINFIVHGASEQIGDKRLLHVDDMVRLHNKNRYPFAVALSCFLSHFDHPSESSFGETLLRSNDKGILALFGSVGKSYQYIDFTLNNLLFDLICQERANTLGEVTTLVKYNLLATSSGFWEPVVNFVLLGDPASRLARAPHQIDMQLSTPVLKPNEKLSVSGEVKNAASGTLTFSVSTADGSLIQEKSIEVRNGSFSTDLFILNSENRKAWGQQGGEGIVRAYFTNGKKDAIAAARFGVSRPLIASIDLDPAQPTIDDSVHVIVRVDEQVAEAVNGIEKVLLRWSLNKDNWQTITLAQKGARWRTSRPIVQNRTLTVYYQVAVGAGNSSMTESAVKQYRVARKPDVLIADNVTIVPNNGACLSVPLRNIGGSPSGTFSIQVVKGHDPRNATIFVKDFRVSNVGAGEDTTVFIPLPQVAPGRLDMMLMADCRGEIAEESENNNITSVSLNTATLQKGSDGPLEFLQGQVSVTLSADAMQRTTSIHVNRSAEQRLLEAAEKASLQMLTLNNGPFIYQFHAGDSTALKASSMTMTVHFGKSVSANNLSIKIFTWNPGTSSWRGHPSTLNDRSITAKIPTNTRFFGVMASHDRSAPDIKIGVNGQNFVDGDVVSLHPTFTILIEDSSGVEADPAMLNLCLDDQKLTENDYQCSIDRKTNRIATITFSPHVSKGEHRLSVTARDIAGNEASEKVMFNVSGDFGLDFIANHPNPFYRETIFAFRLTDMATIVNLDIYTVSGRLIRSFELRDVAGYHEVEWDGMDAFGNNLANGVYYLKFTAVQGEKRIERIEKLAKLE